MLQAEVSKKSCSLVMEITDPVETLGKLAKFFNDRMLQPETLQLSRYRSGNAQVIIHVYIERECIRRTMEMLATLPGIIELLLLELTRRL